MVIDTSALIAILFDEPERKWFIDAIEAASIRLLCAVSYVETAFVIINRKGPNGISDLEKLLRLGAIKLVPVDETHADIAVAAFLRYGKGRGHPAQLNLGDCFAYALAKETGEPLLFKGRDFGRTDIVPAAPVQ